MDAITEDIDSHQYGSVKGSSTVCALVELVHHWQQALDSPGKLLRVLLLDFSKAFDRVDHSILLQRLSSSGAPDLIIRWFTAFLSGRQQRTRLGYNFSQLTLESHRVHFLGQLDSLCTSMTCGLACQPTRTSATVLYGRYAP